MAEPMTPARLLERLALFLLLFFLAFRMTCWSYSAFGTQAFVHLIVPLAMGTWFAARALQGTAAWRWTGLEAPLGLLAILALLSVARSPLYPMAALDGALTMVALAVLVPATANAFGPERRATLLTSLHAVTLVIAVWGALQHFWLLPKLAGSAEAAQLLRSAGELAPELGGRLGAGEPWGTFFYPNTFAGFLVLALPFTLGSLLDLPPTARAALGMRIVTLALGGFLLWATGSKGGLVSGAAAAAGFAFLAVVKRRPEWKARMLAGAGTVGIAILLLGVLGPLSPDALASRAESIAVRDVYWDAGVRIWKSHPVLGVGINNFQEHFTQHKDERQEETLRAHNDYLQVLAELGIPGLLALLAVLAVAARHVAVPEAIPPEAATDPVPLGLAGGALAAGLLGSYVFQRSFGDIDGGPFAALLLTVLAFIAFALGRRGDEEAARAGSPWTRIGLGAGLAGVAVHFAVDFNFTDSNFLAPFGIALAAVALLSRTGEPWRLPRAVTGAAAAACFAISVPVMALKAPAWLAADDAAAAGETLLRQGKVAESEKAYREAIEANPLAPEPWLHVGLIRFHAWKSAAAARKLESGEQLEEESVAAFQNALTVRPRWVSALFWLGHAQLEFSRRLGDALASGELKGGTHEARRKMRLAAAEQAAREAVERYPTRAENRYLLAKVLDLRGEAEEALREYREALRLSGMATRVLRLRMSGIARARCLVRTGGSIEEAAALLAEHFRRPEVLGDRKAPDWNRRVEELRKDPAKLDEYDPVLKPAMDLALEHLGR